MELVGSVRSRAERSRRKASHPGGTALGKSTQACKAFRRKFAWLDKRNYECFVLLGRCCFQD